MVCTSRLLARACLLVLPAATAAVATAAPAQHGIIIPGGKLTTALTALSRQTGLSVGYVGTLPAIEVRTFSGRMSPEAALERILAGSGLTLRKVGPTSYRIESPQAPAPASAGATAHPIETVDVQDILVTATKRSANSFLLPLSVATVSSILKSGQAGLPGTAAVIEGIDAVSSTNLGPGRNRLFIRGVADSPFNGPSQSTVGLYLNEARVNFNAPDPDLRLIDIDRIEVLKGPQGALYGSGALGGVYRIVPKRPDPKGWHGQLAAESGTTAHGGMNGGADGMLNVPLTETLAVRVVGYAEHMAGWIDDTERNLRNVNDVNVAGGRAAVGWNNAGWDVDLGGVFQRTRAHDSQYATIDQGRYSRRTAVAEPHRNRFLSGQGNIRRTIGDIELFASTSLVSQRMTTQYDASLASEALPGQDTPVYLEWRRQRLSSSELRVSDNVGDVRWLFGARYLKANSRMEWSGSIAVDDDEDDEGEDGGEDDADPNDSDVDAFVKSHQEVAVFGEATIPIVASVKATAGFRFFRSRISEEESVTGERIHNRDHGFTPSVALSWEVDPDSFAWLRYASAIRSGGLNPSARSAPFAFARDRLHSVELGVRLRRFNRRLDLEASLFGYHWQNIQSDILLPSGLIGTLNLGHAHNIGGEVSARWSDGAYLFETGATYQKGDVYSHNTVLGTIQDGRLPTVPRLRAHARIEVPVRVGATVVQLGGVTRYVGSARLSFDPLLDRRMAGYAEADAYLRANIRAVQVSLACENLFESAADTFAFGNPFSIRSLYQKTPQRPRTVSLRAEWAF